MLDLLLYFISSFAGDKVTSYGGYLRYVLRNVGTSGYGNFNSAADVQIVSVSICNIVGIYVELEDRRL